MATKKLTEREKKERAKIRKQLRAEGVLPPVKKRLNHERFIEGAKALLKAEKLYDLFPYICWAMIEMMGHGSSARFGLRKSALRTCWTADDFYRVTLDEESL